LEQANELVDKMKTNIKNAINKGQSGVHNLKEDIDDIADIAKKELANH
jgi:hypothetical protein